MSPQLSMMSENDIQILKKKKSRSDSAPQGRQYDTRDWDKI